MPVSRDVKDTVTNGLIAGGESLLSNGIVMAFNVLYKSAWAVPSAESIRGNFTIPWEWEDTDGFKVNNLGHPYQGSTYFNAGRVNGFGFYESLFFSAFGSFTWEALGESNHASINDFITSSIGSMAMGEILYRLYVEAYAAGVPAPLAMLINPAAGIHSLLTGWKPPPNSGRNLYQFQAYLGTGYTITDYSVSGSPGEIFSFNGLFADMGIKAVYGNPFEQDTRIPYRQFEFAMSAGINLSNYLDIRFISDGYLFSFSPVYTETNRMSTGLSLHLDFVSQGKFDRDNGTIDLYCNALDWAVKYQHFFSPDTAVQIKSHAGFTFMGVSNYYSPDTEVNELRNYGCGLNSKLFFNLENKKLGSLEADLLYYILWTYPGTSKVPQGTVFWLFIDISYSRHVSEHISIGAVGSLAKEWGNYSRFPDTRKSNKSTKLFIAWNL